MGVGVAAFVLWERRPSLPVAVLTVGVLVPVALAQLSGGLEPVMFLVSLLGVCVAGWEKSRWRAGVACLAAVVSPVVIAALQPAEDHIASGIWVIGVAFPEAEEADQQRIGIQDAVAHAGGPLRTAVPVGASGT